MWGRLSCGVRDGLKWCQRSARCAHARGVHRGREIRDTAQAATPARAFHPGGLASRGRRSGPGIITVSLGIREVRRRRRRSPANWGARCGRSNEKPGPECSADQNRQRNAGEFTVNKGGTIERVLPRESARSATAKSTPWRCAQGRPCIASVGGRVCGPGDRASKPGTFIGGDALFWCGSPRESDEGSASRGRMSSARTRKVCCTRIGRSRAERSSALAVGEMAPSGCAMETIASGGKA